MTATDLRVMLARTGFEHQEVAERLGIHKTQLSHYLSERRPMPEGFADRFEATVRELVEERAAQIRREANEKADRLLAAVGSEALR